MNSVSYTRRRGQLETYFDRTAARAWERLTSDAPVSGIRATVRAGRDRMRETLLNWLPEDLSGRRVLDAGCGTGAFAIEAARRGAEVVAIDLSTTLTGLARNRLPVIQPPGRVEFVVGDMLDPVFGEFDHVVAMDSLIHYRTPDMVGALDGLAARTTRSIQFTFAPRTPLLTVMHTVGRLFPRGNRAPGIVPVGENAIERKLAALSSMTDWRPSRTKRVITGFYMSQALELVRT